MRKTLKSLCFILSCSAVMHVSSQAAAQDVRTAALTPGNEVLREAPLPAVLAQDDLNRYRRIFALQQADRWADADREIAGLHDKLLVGAVLAQRYQDSGYHPSYAELVQWMQRYGDQPDAQSIFAAALKLRPDGAAQPPAPIGIATTAAKSDSDFEPRPTAGNFGGREMRVLVPAEERQANALRQQIRDLAGTDPRKAELLLAGKDAKALIDDQTRDQLRSTIAEGYLARGKAQEALTMSASTETAAYAPVANWNAGLAAWRLDRMDEARGHFQALARSPDQSPWVKAAAAFWAARVELRFVIGTEAMPADQLAAVAAEAAAYRDMLLIDAPDKDEGQPRVRSATTLKVMHSMRYAVNNYVFDWFARIGDDAYFRVDYFAELALEHTYPKEWAYVGYKFVNHIVSWRRGGRKEKTREQKTCASSTWQAAADAFIPSFPSP